MSRDLTQAELLTELEPVAEDCLNQHLAITKAWNPHDYIPWGDGRNFGALGGREWSEEQSELSEVARVAMVMNLLTEDNLPSYHRYLGENLALDGAWGTWIGRWTAEENRHSIAIRDYLVVTRGVDPVALEEARLEHLTRGARAPDDFDGALVQMVYATIQEIATRVSHRQTGLACADPLADAMLKRIAQDENLHALFYRTVTGAAFDLAPDQVIEAVTNVIKEFDMPGRGMPNWRRNAVLMAKHGIYDLPQHLDEVLLPVLRTWRVFERNDLSGAGEKHRDELAEFIENLRRAVTRFEERRAHLLERQAAKAARTEQNPPALV